MPGREYDDQIADGRVPHDMNRWLDFPVFRPGIILEGGSIDTNGRGTILTTRPASSTRTGTQT